MPAQPNPYLVMTDGTTTVTFADGAGGLTNYPPLREGWAPAVAALRRSELGGVGPYADVIEELEININGADAATALANLGALSRLLDQAERWWRRGENVSPVLIKYAPQGSTVSSSAAPLQAIVLGRADGDETNLNLSDRFNDVGMIKQISSVRVRFVRRGLWLLASEATATSGSSQNPTVLTRTFGSAAAIPSPLTIDLGGFTASAATIASGVLLVADSSSRITILEAENLGTGAPYTSVADGANNARGGNVLRYTPTGTAAATTPVFFTLDPTVDRAAKRVGVWAAVRNNSTTRNYTVQVRTGPSGASPGVTLGPETLIDTSSQQPRIVFLGMLISRSGHYVLDLSCSVDTTSGSGTLDIDYLVLHVLDGMSMAYHAAAANDGGDMTPFFPGTATLHYEHHALDDVAPIVALTNGSLTIGIAYHGGAFLATLGTTVAACWLATGGPGGSGTSWRYASGGTVESYTLKATRNIGYQVPQ